MKEEIKAIKQRCLHILTNNRLSNIGFHQSASLLFPDLELTISVTGAILTVKGTQSKHQYVLDFNDEKLYENGAHVTSAAEYRKFLKALAQVLNGKDRYTRLESGQRKPI